MTTITTRSGKGSELTYTELDDNFTNLNTSKLEDITGESIGDLSDVDLTNNTDGYVLTYNSTSGNLELAAAAGGGGGGASSLNDLSDCKSDSTLDTIGIGDGALASATTLNGTVAIGHACLTSGTNKPTWTVAIGHEALKNITAGSSSIAIGRKVASVNAANISNCVFIGNAAALNASGLIEDNIGLGSAVFYSLNGGDNNIGLGSYTFYNLTTGSNNVAIGHLAGRYQTSGATLTNFTNTIMLGYDTRVSASNQVQLGNADTTTYAYGSVQDRSDQRDKTDIEDTALGLSFIKDLRPVDFRWDYRENYFDKVETEIVVDGETVTTTTLQAVPKDGSRKRNRKHHGLIAQEVKQVMDAHGVDFAGYQDHSINGGNDVLSIGYSELIAPLIKAVQELSAQVEALQAEVNELNGE